MVPVEAKHRKTRNHHLYHMCHVSTQCGLCVGGVEGPLSVPYVSRKYTMWSVWRGGWRDHYLYHMCYVSTQCGLCGEGGGGTIISTICVT